MATGCPKASCPFSIPEGTDVALAIALLEAHVKIEHTRDGAVKAKPVERPIISAGETTEGWDYFLTRWRAYHKAAKLAGDDKGIQLLECLEPDLRRDLTRTTRGGVPLEERPEADLLAAIKAMAVVGENYLEGTFAFARIKQDRGESHRKFASRLRGVAKTCDYVEQCGNCGHQVDYSESRVSDQLCLGLADPGIQQDLVEEIDKRLTVEQTLRFVEKKSSGKRTATAVKEPATPSTDALETDREEVVSSSYKRQQRPQNQATPKATPQATPQATPKSIPRRPQATTPDKGICTFCGRQGHGTSSRTAIRRVQCPAFGKTCQTCGRQNHYAKQCWQTMELESEVHETVLDMTEGTLPHQVWSQAYGEWTQRKSPPQPTLAVTISTKRSDYQVHGHTLRKEGAITSTLALADTGCQSCLAGTQVMKGLGLEQKDLIPSSLTMRSASGNQLPIIGATLTRIEDPRTGNKTRQMVYISPAATKLYLSLSACADLGLVRGDFPQRQVAAAIGDRQTPPGPPAEATIHQPTDTARPCHCPNRAPPPPRPTTLPYPPTEENRERLEQYLLNKYAASAFNICDHQTLPMMSGPPLSFTIDPTATPKPCHTPIPIPIHWQEEVKKGLDRDVRLGVLEKVPLGTPVTWCHRMVICTKKNGSLRRTIDFQPLNKHATRETHHCPSPFHQARAIPRGTKKTIFDAWNGYHSVALKKEDRHYTTFITPWGRYRYLTAPQGYIASGDAYTSRYDALVAHIGAKTKCVDDALIWSSGIEEAFHQATEWLDICGGNGITLNPTKFRFAKDQVEFAGFTVTLNEVRPADKFTAAIKGFPTPSNITDVRAWFGLVNQVSYSFAMTAAMLPFRELLKPTTPFEWSDKLSDALLTSKNHICASIAKGVEIFDKGRPTCLATDWSKHGIGFWLTQKHCRCLSPDPFCCRDGWRVTLVGSRFTHAAESRYAPVEGEALAVADALDRARHFVLGCSDLTIAVDHKPLLKLLSDRCLEDIPNPRLRNLKERTLRYRFRMAYIPGARNLTSDALSRHPSGPRSPPRLHLQDDIQSPGVECRSSPTAASEELHHLHSTSPGGGDLRMAMCSALSTTPIGWEQLQTATTEDTALQDLMVAIEEGTPASKDLLPPPIQSYFHMWNSLTIVDDVVCCGSRVVIPEALRQQCLQALHSAHQGTSGMMARAASSVYWPGITADIKAARDHCTECNSNAPSQPHLPPTTPETPDRPFSTICADYFHHAGSQYLVVVDRFSGWPIVAPATKGAAGLAAVLRDTFASFGIPDTITTDGGPEFTAHSTREFLANWGVQHRLCSAYNPHANNRAETAVKSMKRLIAGNTGPGGALTSSFHKALLTYRNAPAPDTKMSPAMSVLGRPTRDMLPSLPSRLRVPQDNPAEVHRKSAIRKRQSAAHSRWDEHTGGLSPLRCGDRVHVQNQHGNHPGKWDCTGVVTEVLQYHQYAVRMDVSGRLTTRNRRHLRRNSNAKQTPEDALRSRLAVIPPLRPRPPTPPPPPTPLPPTPRPPTPPAADRPVHAAPATQPLLASPQAPTPATPLAPMPTHTQAPKKLQFPTSPTQTRPRSYASVAGTPPTIRPPNNPAKAPPAKHAKPPTQPPPLRWSTRTRAPLDRYGQ